jgi:hypothetical protein
MTKWMQRLIVRIAAHKLRKEIEKMGPLPKWVGVITWVATNMTAWFAAYQVGGWKALIAAIIVSVTSTGQLVSHSVNGTGGTPKNP